MSLFDDEQIEKRWAEILRQVAEREKATPATKAATPPPATKPATKPATPTPATPTPATPPPEPSGIDLPDYSSMHRWSRQARRKECNARIQAYLNEMRNRGRG